MEILKPHPHPEINSIKIEVYRNKNNLKTSSISLRFSAQFDRPKRTRKNHLRKKLQIQVPPSLTTSSPTKPPIHDNDSLSISNPNPNPNPNSNDEIRDAKTRVLWNQLETWATQYKADAEFRGILNDKLNKIDVNEVEILTPSNSINNLNYDKVSSVFNSSVTSYVLDTFKTKPGKVGISVFSCFVVFLVFKSLFRKQKEELSSLEKEMLIRKMKAREKSTKAGGVEVIQDSEKPQMVELFKERPQVDKQELMNTIVASNDNKSCDFDGKIQEIRAMARHAREIEKTDGNTINEDDVSINNQPNEKEVHPQGDVSRTLNGLTSQNKGDDQSVARGNLLDKKPRLRIISSVKEAREYLVDKKKHDKNEATVDQLPEKMFDSKSLNLGENENGNVVMNDSDSKEEERVDLGRGNREKWMEDNFNEFEPVVDKIRGGFRKNYMVAKEKVKEDVNLVLDLEVESENESEFEWMKDEKLKEIVFQVRENELTGRDPFYLMDNEDKALFFKGLEKKVEKENEKLAHLHQYLHSNIENLDYGADGISLYDPLEKMIPRWKGPPPIGGLENINQNKIKKNPKTVIERSDGSIKPGKKSGKEFWQHTKKWSRGFVDSYNSENDPETKAVMKDIGKDLDRWITEKEIQEAADVMEKLPDKGKTFITEKIQKLKREMEVFGPQAVVSKYSEYGDDEEVDYYWWLDLPFLLCIELYINGDGDGDERVGFYSLEMAPDLELDPKPHHIIAFEDAGDCKNLCYIIQTHMEMLGNGHAFVVPQPPKDTYQEAKGNGFNVTVIRKGEVKLDVDQTLEEVEDKIVEIGSQMYHDKIIKDRNVDVDSLIKGVFGLDKSKPPRRRSKKKLKKPTSLT